mmetsp:Transcript_10312/g.19530  ORF Transcript_10312/g.19530 Transcript_10312/m.19530 type:complete len:248 (-) Transcript_10312:404-1147(-)
MGGDYPPIENKLGTCGMFSLPGSIHAGDHYVKDKPAVMSRYRGKQMVVPGTVWGKNQDAMIDKEFKRLSENDVYMDPGAAERKARLANKKHVSDKAFLPSSPMKTTRGKGTHVGCFGKYEYVERPQPERREKSGPGPKNFLPSKAVKGTYGMTGHFLAPPLEFIADPFLNSRVFEKDDKRAAREKNWQAVHGHGPQHGLVRQNPLPRRPRSHLSTEAQSGPAAVQGVPRPRPLQIGSQLYVFVSRAY